TAVGGRERGDREGRARAGVQRLEGGCEAALDQIRDRPELLWRGRAIRLRQDAHELIATARSLQLVEVGGEVGELQVSSILRLSSTCGRQRLSGGRDGRIVGAGLERARQSPAIRGVG